VDEAFDRSSNKEICNVIVDDNKSDRGQEFHGQC